MVRIITGQKIYTEGLDFKYYIEATGLSTDEKKTDGVANGSIFTEVDTGKVYFFDEDGEQWIEQFSFQG